MHVVQSRNPVGVLPFWFAAPG